MKKTKPGIGTEFEIFMQQRYHNRAIKEAQGKHIYQGNFIGFNIKRNLISSS